MTNEIKIYVANLGKYNEGELVGNWFTLPVDLEEMYVEIGVGRYDEDGEYVHGVIEYDEQGNAYHYEEWAIHDYEAPFEISEYESIAKLNDIAEKISDLDGYELDAVVELVNYGCVSDFDEAIEKIQDGEVHFYHECNSMEDVAYEIVEQTGMLSQVPENLQFYFDYEKFGRDLAIEGTFIELEGSVYMEVAF